MTSPISVLTGLDCWLDNLMCNVPEVAMCFHIDGIVQVGNPLDDCDMVVLYFGVWKQIYWILHELSFNINFYLL